jgi:hypothetical protein
MVSVHAAAFAGAGGGEGTGMAEPKEIAERVDEAADGVRHWRIHNAAIGGGISSSHAVLDRESGCVLVDPVRLAPEALGELPRPDAVALTARTHQARRGASTTRTPTRRSTASRRCSTCRSRRCASRTARR